jgi:hypothetical protein
VVADDLPDFLKPRLQAGEALPTVEIKGREAKDEEADALVSYTVKDLTGGLFVELDDMLRH